jgi:hypothetical protein
MTTRHRGIVFGTLLSICVITSGCAEVKQDVREASDLLYKYRGRVHAPPPPSPPSATLMPWSAVGGLSLQGNCVSKEEAGYAEYAKIDIEGGQVRQLDARIDIPGHGSCHYQLAEFRQTQQTPYVELLERLNESCVLRMWRQGNRITFAATNCSDKCSRDAYDYAWPIEFNTAGGCASG